VKREKHAGHTIWRSVAAPFSKLSHATMRGPPDEHETLERIYEGAVGSRYASEWPAIFTYIVITLLILAVFKAPRDKMLS